MGRKRILCVAMVLFLGGMMLSTDSAYGRTYSGWNGRVSDGVLNSRNGTRYGVGPGQLVCTTYVGWAVRRFYGVRGYPPGGFVRSHNGWLQRHGRLVCSLSSAREYSRKGGGIRPGDIVCFNTGYGFSGVWIHVAIVGGDGRTLHHAIRTGVRYQYSLYGWISHLHQAKSCKVYRLSGGAKFTAGTKPSRKKSRKRPKVREKKIPIRYLKAGGKPLDFRSFLTSKLWKEYRVNQGAASDGRYMYFAFSHRKHPYTYGRIVKYDPQNQKVIRVSKRLSIGGCSDMVYDKKKKRLLITCLTKGKKKRRSLAVVATNTLRQKKSISIPIPKKCKGGSRKQLRTIQGFSAIAYDSKKGRYYLKTRHRSYVLILNNKFQVKEYRRMNKKYRWMTPQSMTIRSGALVRVMGNGKNTNVISICSKSGKEKQRYRLKGKGVVQGMFWHKKKLYVTIYQKKKGKPHMYIASVWVEK